MSLVISSDDDDDASVTTARGDHCSHLCKNPGQSCTFLPECPNFACLECTKNVRGAAETSHDPDLRVCKSCNATIVNLLPDFIHLAEENSPTICTTDQNKKLDTLKKAPLREFTYSTSEKVRKAVCNHMTDNPKIYRDTLLVPTEFDLNSVLGSETKAMDATLAAHINNMQKKGTYATEREVYALANTISLPITVTLLWDKAVCLTTLTYLGVEI